jgi:hypothetical protein
VASHQDDDTPWDTIVDLQSLKPSPEATLNALCDKKAEEACLTNQSYPDADALPAEKQDLFACVPYFHIITCKQDTALINTPFYDDILQYVATKHNLMEAKLGETMTDHLECYLRSHKPQSCTMMVKLIHKWISTNDFLHKQG